MSFYTTLKTEMTDKQYILCALKELARRGEIINFVENEKKEELTVDRDGDILNIVKEKTGHYQVSGDARVVERFSNRLKQMYAYESIKENLPLDFEISQEVESGGEIKILLKG